ncbi:MAG TPA: hypothetical protein EYQ50_17985, partial [Verrucomicrobiales bacterium]|nr:hypothetical protein [Verrucomicrobiales bacterium]
MNSLTFVDEFGGGGHIHNLKKANFNTLSSSVKDAYCSEKKSVIENFVVLTRLKHLYAILIISFFSLVMTLFYERETLVDDLILTAIVVQLLTMSFIFHIGITKQHSCGIIYLGYLILFLIGIDSLILLILLSPSMFPSGGLSEWTHSEILLISCGTVYLLLVLLMVYMFHGISESQKLRLNSWIGKVRMAALFTGLFARARSSFTSFLKTGVKRVLPRWLRLVDHQQAPNPRPFWKPRTKVLASIVLYGLVILCGLYVNHLTQVWTVANERASLSEFPNSMAVLRIVARDRHIDAAKRWRSWCDQWPPLKLDISDIPLMRYHSQGTAEELFASADEDGISNQIVTSILAQYSIPDRSNLVASVSELLERLPKHSAPDCLNPRKNGVN